MENQTLLILLFGLPAAGKSSISRTLVKISSDLHPEWEIHHVEFDKDYERIGDKMNWTPSKWREARAESLARIRGLLNSPGNGRFRLIVCDDNAWYASMRKEIYSLCRKSKASFLSLLVYQDLNTCIERDRLRPSTTYANGQVGEATIRKMYPHFVNLLHLHPDRVIFCACDALADDSREIENYKYHSWEQKHSFSVHSCMDSAEVVGEGVLGWIASQATLLSHLVPPDITEYSQEELQRLEEEAAASTKNLIHRMDNSLRRIIGRCMRRYQQLRKPGMNGVSLASSSREGDSEGTNEQGELVIPGALLMKFLEQKDLVQFFTSTKKEILHRTRSELKKDELLAEIADDALEEMVYQQLLECFNNI